jgi:hypothetical protein
MRGSTAGISDNFKGSRRHYMLLSVLDTVLSALVVSPAVIGYWRGTWMIMDRYVFPNQHTYSSWVSVAIGYLGHILFTLLQMPITKRIHPDHHWLSYYIVSRLYTAIFGFVCVNSWRGVWRLLEYYTGHHIEPLLGTTVASIVALAALRTLRNISSPPFSITTDCCDGYFRVPTMFRVSVSCMSLPDTTGLHWNEIAHVGTANTLWSITYREVTVRGAVAVSSYFSRSRYYIQTT